MQQDTPIQTCPPTLRYEICYLTTLPLEVLKFKYHPIKVVDHHNSGAVHLFKFNRTQRNNDRVYICESDNFVDKLSSCICNIFENLIEKRIKHVLHV